MIPPTLNWNVTGWLVYDQSKPTPQATILQEFNPYDDTQLVAQDGDFYLSSKKGVILHQVTCKYSREQPKSAYF